MAIRLAKFALLVSGVLSLCSCGGGSGGAASNTGNAGGGAPPSSVAAVVGATGGALALAGQSITFPAGSLTDGTNVVFSTTSDSDIQSRFLDGTLGLGPAVLAASTELRIKVGMAVPALETTADLTLPSDLQAALSLNGSQVVVAFYAQQFDSDDDEAGESMDSFEAAPTVFDQTSGRVTVTIPPQSYEAQSDGTFKATIKIGLIDNTIAPASEVNRLQATSSRVGPRSALCNPKSAVTALANPLGSPTGGPPPQLIVVGAYGETDPAHAGRYHPGIDLRANLGTPVLAAQAGYIEFAGISGRGAIYVVVRLVDNSAISYFHLKPNSLAINEPMVLDPKSGVTYQAYKETTPCTPHYPLAVGSAIGLSGDSGAAGRPHLHFGYTPATYREQLARDPTRAGSYWSTMNSIHLLGTMSATFASSGSSSLSLSGALLKDQVQLHFLDNTTQSEIQIRRHKSPDVLASVLAQGDWNSIFNPGSFTPTFTVSWSEPVPPVRLSTFASGTPPYQVASPQGQFTFDSAQAEFAVDSASNLSAPQAVTVTARTYDPTGRQSAVVSSSVTISVEPTFIPTLSTGYGTSCSVGPTGGLKCWGYNLAGSNGSLLGDGTTNSHASPVDVLGLSTGVRAVAVGYFSTCAVMISGSVKCWGWNFAGQLGNGSLANSSSPVDVVGLSGVSTVSVGADHACALLLSGAVYCWGSNGAGQLGVGSTLAPASKSSIPVPVAGLDGGVIQILAGQFHTCALTRVGGVKCWGANGFDSIPSLVAYPVVGALGDGTTADHATPSDVLGLLSGVVAIGGNQSSTCAALATGGVRCWGDNESGLVDSPAASLLQPTDVSRIAGVTVATISVGYGNACVVTSAGGAKCWGANGNGELGDGTVLSRSGDPEDVAGLTSGVAEIAAGGSFTCARTASQVKCWGYNASGQVGDGTYVDRYLPTGVLSY